MVAGRDSQAAADTGQRQSGAAGAFEAVEDSAAAGVAAVEVAAVGAARTSS